MTESITRAARGVVLALTLAVAIMGPHQARGQQPFSRGLETVSFIPKGQWITGVSVNYSQSSQHNYQFLIAEGINGETYDFKVTPMGMYCFRDNLAAGVKLGYGRQRVHLNSADIVLDSDTDYSMDNLYQISNKFYGMAALRYYISLGQGKRFGLFNELQLELAGGRAKLCNGSGDDLTGQYQKNFSIDVGLAPGMVMFLNNYSAIEVNVGVLGFSYDHTTAIRDQVHVSHTSLKQARFKINLFSITFGVAFYL